MSLDKAGVCLNTRIPRNMQESANTTVHFERDEETGKKVDAESTADIRSRLRSSHVPLYVNHFCSAFGESVWLFTMGIFLVMCAPGSLRLTAIHGFTYTGARLLLGAVVDQWTKRNNILTVAYMLLIARNTAVAVCTSTVALLLVGQVGAQATGDIPAKTAAQGFIVVTSAIAGVASLGQASLEKHWTLSIHDDDVTAVTYRVDVACRVVAPLLTGYMMTSFSVQFVAICVTSWSIVTVFIGLFLFRFTYESLPQGLRRYITSHRVDLNETSPLLTSVNYPIIGWTGNNGARGGNSVEREEKSATRDGYPSLLLDNFSALRRGWEVYWKHAAAGAGVALAILHFTVVRLDNIVVGFAKDRGMAEVILGTFVSGSVLLAILGESLLSSLRGKIGQRKTGLLAFLIILVSLTLPVASLLVPDNLLVDTTPNDNLTSANVKPAAWWLPGRTGLPSLSLLLLVTGIALGSFGVSLAEATVASLLEDGPSESDKDVVRRVQRSFNLMAQLAKWMLVLTLPWPRTFGLVIILTFYCVFVAAFPFAFCSGSGFNGGHRGYNSLFFAVAAQPQKRFAGSCNAPLNL